MKLHWIDRAVDHLLTIYEYISKDSPYYAEKMVDRLTRRSEQFKNFPGSGRKVPEYNTENIREVIEGRYRIIKE